MAHDYGLSLSALSSSLLVGVGLRFCIQLQGDTDMRMQFYRTCALQPPLDRGVPPPLALGRHVRSERREQAKRQYAAPPPGAVVSSPLHLESLLIACGAKPHMSTSAGLGFYPGWRNCGGSATAEGQPLLVLSS